MDKVSDVMPLVSVVAIVMIIGGIVAVNAEKIVSCGVLVLGVVAIHNFCGMMLGFLAAKNLPCGVFQNNSYSYRGRHAEQWPCCLTGSS